jgi:hypothetical protein
LRGADARLLAVSACDFWVHFLGGACALVLFLALAACEAPIPEVTEEQIAYRLNDPAKSGADNIATIGAEALCDTPEQAVTERQGVGSVTYCAPAP